MRVQMPAWLNNMVYEELQWVREHKGPFPSNPYKALALLTEEVGEVAKEVLQFRKCRDRADLMDMKGKAVRELVQVITTAMNMAVMLHETDPQEIVKGL